MQYLGIDVHSAASVWCLLDETGEQVATGRTDTTFPALRDLATELRAVPEPQVYLQGFHHRRSRLARGGNSGDGPAYDSGTCLGVETL